MGWRESFRYGPICLLALGTALFAIICPEGNFDRAVVIALCGTMLAIAVITSNLTSGERHRAATGATILMVGLTVLTLLGTLSATVVAVASGLFAAATVLAIVGGLVKLVRTQGVTIRAVAGGLAIYALIGLVFAFAVDVAARVGGKPFYLSGIDGTLSEHVYYSFTIMTTTGLGDFAPGRSGGRTLAAAEMLFGQIYLVTVVALLISNVRRPKAN